MVSQNTRNILKQYPKIPLNGKPYPTEIILAYSQSIFKKANAFILDTDDIFQEFITHILECGKFTTAFYRALDLVYSMRSGVSVPPWTEHHVYIQILSLQTFEEVFSIRYKDLIQMPVGEDQEAVYRYEKYEDQTSLILQALPSLPKRQREIIECLQNNTHMREMSRVLRVSPKSLNYSKHLALKRMKVLCQDSQELTP